MSTKIYSGFEVHGHTLESLWPQLQQLRADMRTRADELLASWLTQRAAAFRDRSQFGLTVYFSEPVSGFYKGMGWLSAAWAETQERQRRVAQTRRRDREVDFSAELVFFPLDGRLLGMSFIEHRELEALWQDCGWQRDYAYWNNTDGPEDVTEQDWEKRREDWNRVFRHSAMPSEAGYAVKLLDTECYPPPTEGPLLTRQLPAAATRVSELAMDLYLKEHPEVLLGVGDSDPLSRVMAAMRTVERSADFAAWKVVLEGRLPALTVDSLYEKADDGIVEQGLAAA